MNKKLQKNLGNALMAFSFLGLVIIYYPIAKEFIFPPKYTQEEIKSAQFSVEIPSIQVFSKVIENVDPFNETEYIEKLKEGVAHAKGTALPGEKGTIYMFAHSSDVPWRITRYNTAFFKLGQVQNGDEIVVRRDGKEFKYKVFDKKSVWPDQIQFLTEPQGDVLILQTCTPVGTSLMRLLVFARPT